VQKDPSRTLKDQNIDTTQYWQLLNNLPQKGVDRVVTKLVLNADKQSCSRILTRIFEQKKYEDDKKSL
jgi:hypothetical protein